MRAGAAAVNPPKQIPQANRSKKPIISKDGIFLLVFSCFAFIGIPPFRLICLCGLRLLGIDRQGNRVDLVHIPGDVF